MIEQLISEWQILETRCKALEAELKGLREAQKKLMKPFNDLPQYWIVHVYDSDVYKTRSAIPFVSLHRAACYQWLEENGYEDTGGDGFTKGRMIHQHICGRVELVSHGDFNYKEVKNIYKELTAQGNSDNIPF